jgi:hypothetical protein
MALVNHNNFNAGNKAIQAGILKHKEDIGSDALRERTENLRMD